jgi:hypothetical protein
MNLRTFSHHLRYASAAVLVVLLIDCMSTKRHALSSPNRPSLTNVCALVAKSGAFNGRRVAVNACVAADGYEHLNLVDEHSECNGVTLVPLEASRGALPINIKNNTCGTFTGTFQWNRNPLIVGQTHVLYVETVADVHVRKVAERERQKVRASLTSGTETEGSDLRFSFVRPTGPPTPPSWPHSDRARRERTGGIPIRVELSRYHYGICNGEDGELSSSGGCSDTSSPGTAALRNHLRGPRQLLADAVGQCTFHLGFARPAYTDTLTTGSPIKALYFTELQGRTQ